MKKIKLHSEIIYLIATALMALAVAMSAAADFGVSMIVAPAYIFSLKFDFLTFGQSEYILQGILFAIFCIVMKKIKIEYFVSFLDCLLYGAILDFLRDVIPLFNPAAYPSALWVRILFFISGMLITTYSVSLFFDIYLYPQVYDFFVIGFVKQFKLNASKFKRIYDFTLLAVGCVMTLAFFGSFRGIELGTLVLTVCNGFLIGFFNKFNQKHIEIVPLFPKFAKRFEFD